MKKAPEVGAFVDGGLVHRLYVSFPGEGAFLITEDAGTHSVGRVFVVDGVCRAGDRLDNRIGPGVITSVNLDTDRGCTIQTTAGNLFIPAARLYATWLP